MHAAWIRLLIALVALVWAAGSVAPARAQDDLPSISGSLTFGGVERTYRLYRPPALTRSTAVPLLMMLHGGYGTGAQAERAYHWDTTADANNFVVVYPDGVNRSWNAGDCCGKSRANGIDDVGFLSALITLLAQQQHIDTTRIYVTGMSNGALMAYHLACETPHALAAIGPVAGTFAPSCRGSHRTSVIAIHGLADTSIPYNGGLGLQTKSVTFPSVPSTIAWWRSFDGCGSPVTTSDGVVTTSRSSCAAGRDVELITISGAGHQWPGGRVLTPAQEQIARRFTGRTPVTPSTALDATATLWKFFAAHPRLLSRNRGVRRVD